ncbi:hypothetical protein Fmac_018809 [Flemingia macrophylla]|uniref:NB-ARC domain-containing protein n=1 Tax=Flemingia macrophylla TaxID=520843 RepID=A0ABD1M625_9FABA
MSYNNNLKTLDENVRNLVATETTLRQRVPAGERMIDTVQNWQKDANKAISDAKKLIETEEDRWCLGKCPNLWTRNQQSKQFEQCIETISGVLKNSNFVGDISYREIPRVIDTPSSRDYVALNSRTEMLNDMKKTLEDPRIYMIGVHGMDGVGKKALVKELAWQLNNNGLFGCTALAQINRPLNSEDVQPVNEEDIQDRIAKILFGQELFERKDKLLRAGELRKKIKEQKGRVLIILEDVWRELPLKEMGIPFDEPDGCKIVLISTNLNLLTKMGTQKDFPLEPLSVEDSWILFKKVAGDVVDKDTIKSIAKEVSECCVGLPLLITAVAKGLRKKEESDWRDALEELEKLDRVELQETFYSTLKLSYNCLEDKDLQSLFLVIGSFGLNVIQTEDLFLYCLGLGFYGKRTLIEARKKHYNQIKNLIASSLLLEGEPECVRMHHLVRGVARSIVSKTPPTYPDQLHKCHCIIFPSYFSYGLPEKLNLPCGYELPEKLKFPELKLLLLYNGGNHMRKVPDNFFSEIEDVRTLSFREMSFTPSLPSSLLHLTNLRSLNLHGCDLKDIRGVENLTTLEILNLERSTIRELPKKISKLSSIRLLYLTNCSGLQVIPTNLLSSLKCLEELYLRGSGLFLRSVKGTEKENNYACLGELQKLHNLTTLEISIRDTSNLPRDLRFPTKLKRYTILIGYSLHRSRKWYGDSCGTSRKLGLTDSWWKSISLTTAEDVVFDKLKGVKDLLYELDVEGFPQLKHLHIKRSHELLHIINSRRRENSHLASAFPNLETLVLGSLENVEEICYGPLSTESFAKLKVITITCCDKLKNLLLYSLVRNLSQLREIDISYCQGMKEIVTMDKPEDEKELVKIEFPELHSLKLQELLMLQSICLPLTADKGNPSFRRTPLSLFNQQVVMPKLEELTLHTINACTIWDDEPLIQFCVQSLTTLTVIMCGRLTSLFSSSVAKALTKLQHLEIVRCSTLKQMFVGEEVQFSNLETLEIKYIGDLKSIWPNEVAPDSFCKLKEVKIVNCTSLNYVFSVSVAKELRQIQTLTIVECAIKNVVEEGGSCDMALVNLEISGCHNMKTIVPSSVEFPNLEQLNVARCNEVVNIITTSTTKCFPKLRSLVISSCKKLEEIYGSSDEGDAPSGEVAFMKLDKLMLIDLPKLKSFCNENYDFNFESRDSYRQMEVYLKECPLMETFCRGKLITPRNTIKRMVVMHMMEMMKNEDMTNI